MMPLFRFAGVAGFITIIGCQAKPKVDAAGGDQGATLTHAAFLEDVESFTMTLEASGREYSISVALPYDYADSAKTYAVLYGLDANGQFGTLVETARMLRFGEQIPQLIIVGIGYPFGGRQLNAEPHRIIDFFPVLERGWIEVARPNWPEPIPVYDTGHANQFLEFITAELIPLIEARYRVDSRDRAIYGHSGGGWFSLYAILEGAGTFRRAIIGSPSLWWGHGLMFDLEAAYAERNESLPARVFLSVGADEPNTPFADIDCFCMTINVGRLTDTLEKRKYKDFEWTTHIFEGENHNSVVPPTISRGLRYIYGSN